MVRGQVRDKTWDSLRHGGYFVEEAVDDGGKGSPGAGTGNAGTESGSFDEKSALMEKLAMHLSDLT